MTKKVHSLSAHKKLEELREEARVICEPRYHEFYKNVYKPGFIKITIPKTRP